MKTRIISLLLVLCFVMAALSACGKDEPKDSHATTTSPAEHTTAAEAGETTTTVADVHVEDETFVLEAEGNKKDYTPLNYKVTKGIWISQWDIQGIFTTRNSASFKVQMRRVLKTIVEHGFNTVILQVRPYGDSYYPSEIFPESKFINGDYGLKKDFDVLKEFIALAHDKGLSVHAWINPLRLMTPGEMEKVESKYLIRQWFDDEKKNGDYIVEVSTEDGARLYLNPAREEVRKLIIDGAAEICNNYDIDALHIDDYFYPTTDESFDLVSYREFEEKDGSMQLVGWRRDNVNKLVKGLYDTVKAADCRLQFGISPAGDISHNMTTLYADVKTWCGTTGYLDYICPQLYWSFNDRYGKFDNSYLSWLSIVKSPDVRLYIGLALYKAGSEGDWKNEAHDVLKQEIEHIIADGSGSGIMVFSYQDLVAAAAAKVKEVENFTDTMKNWK